MRKRRYLKTVQEKLETKLENLLSTDFVTRTENTFLYRDREIFSVDQRTISYGKIRVSQTRINPFYDAEYNVTRPCATIIIAGIQRIAKDYDDLTGDKPRTKQKYEDNMWQAYRELKNTHKNIKITTYSELIDGAELRLKSGHN